MIPESSDIHLLLAHLLTDKKYCEFYRERQRRGDMIIIDNGAFEFKEPMDPDQYADLIKRSGIFPDVVVAPDYPNQSWEKTVDAGIKFVKKFRKKIGDSVEIMAVPQSKKGDYEGWLDGYSHLTNIDGISWIGMSILGIPNAFCSITGTSDITFNRVFATSLMIDRGLIDHEMRHHYLGCGDPREIAMMIAQGVAFSNDSSTAIWHGIEKRKFDETKTGLKGGKSTNQVDFFIHKVEDVEIDKCISHNIEWIEAHRFKADNY